MKAYKYIFKRQEFWQEELTEFHESILRDAELDEFTGGDLYIILEELISNYFKYSVQPKYKFGIEVRIDILTETIEIILEYEGDDFNPFNYHPVLYETDVENASIGGKGIQMVKKLAETFFYARENYKIKLHIVKNRIMETEMTFTERIEGNVLILSLDGRLDIMSCDSLQKKFDEIIDIQKQNLILVDCEKLSFISSAGLRLFMIALKKLNKINGKIAFCAFNMNNRKIFDITGYDKFFSIYDSIQEALEAF
ncbi:MAG: anti-sigma factor antagonist [Ignavibacteria bacterium]|nr:anti-sigma factor antagonist [Ignavibacteria bacterium]